MLTTVFWTIAATTVVWLAVFAGNYEIVSGSFGEKGSRLATTLLMGLLALTSGLLVLHYRRSGGNEDYWTGSELVYMLALFLSLFYGFYSFFGWFLYA